MNIRLIKRVVAALLGIGGAANGGFMLAAPPLWYDSVPGLAHTGPFNPHFVSDIGVAYVVAGLALLSHARGDRVIGLRLLEAPRSCADTRSFTCSTS
ncbi:MAG: hypothetical protein IPG56_03225 [Caulobacteraceae bacterium]|nr:hypothetical protein [Caulobacteraceae bacterium]